MLCIYMYIMKITLPRFTIIPMCARVAGLLGICHLHVLTSTGMGVVTNIPTGWADILVLGWEGRCGNGEVLPKCEGHGLFVAADIFVVRVRIVLSEQT